MKNFRRVALVLLVAVAFLFTGMDNLSARSRGGGSRSFSRPSPRRSAPKSTPRKSTPSKSTRSAPKKTAPKATKPKTSKRTTTAPKRSATQQKSYEASKKNGTSKMTKAQSMSKFKNDKAMQAKTTSKYATKPLTRPSHIPTSYSRGGVTHTVTYYPGHSGYGSMHNGLFTAYVFANMATDAMMLNQMQRNGYLYAGHPNVVSNRVVVRQYNYGAAIMWTIIGVGLIVVLVVVCNKRAKKS